jgi:hypothetical protein
MKESLRDSDSLAVRTLQYDGTRDQVMRNLLYGSPAIAPNQLAAPELRINNDLLLTSSSSTSTPLALPPAGPALLNLSSPISPPSSLAPIILPPGPVSSIQSSASLNTTAGLGAVATGALQTAECGHLSADRNHMVSTAHAVVTSMQPRVVVAGKQARASQKSKKARAVRIEDSMRFPAWDPLIQYVSLCII